MLNRHVKIITAIALMSLSFAVSAEELYVSAEVGKNGRLELHLSNGTVQEPPLDTYQDAEYPGAEVLNQVSFKEPRLSEDHRTAGWLAVYPSCCTSYPIPLELVIYRRGAVMRKFRGDGTPIWGWQFTAQGHQVAFVQSPTHGDLPDHYELHDVETGALIAQYDHPQSDAPDKVPAWARGVK